MAIALTPLQIDALKEIANIGSHNAATFLSHLVDSPIHIRSSFMNLITVQEFTENLTAIPDKLVIVTQMDVLGGIQGNILLFMDNIDAMHLVELLMGRKPSYEAALQTVERQVIKQLSVVLSVSYLFALSKFLQMTIVPGDPTLKTITAREAAEHVLQPLSQLAHSGILIRNEFLEAKSKVEGHLLLLPYQKGLESLLELINEKIGGRV